VHVIGRGWQEDPAGGARKYAAAVPRLRARMRRGDVDLVHAHYSYPGLLALAQRQAPVVVTYHGDDVLGTIGPDGQTTGLSRRVVVPASRWLAQRAAATIVQSEEMARALHNPRTHIVPCEVDFDVFHPTARAAARAELGLHPDHHYLLFAANPQVAVKNHPFARAVSERVREQFPDAALLTIHEATQARLALYMNACDVLLFPSYQEGSPNVVKQALACDLPIVATDVGDVRSVIGDAPECAVVDLDLDVFAKQVEHVLATRRRTIGAPHVARFAPARVASALIAIYCDVLRRSQRAAGAR
jgi:glycosyltransferase involved in cell wall biosynthesis